MVLENPGELNLKIEDGVPESHCGQEDKERNEREVLDLPDHQLADEFCAKVQPQLTETTFTTCTEASDPYIIPTNDYAGDDRYTVVPATMQGLFVDSSLTPLPKSITLEKPSTTTSTTTFSTSTSITSTSTETTPHPPTALPKRDLLPPQISGTPPSKRHQLEKDWLLKDRGTQIVEIQPKNVTNAKAILQPQQDSYLLVPCNSVSGVLEMVVKLPEDVLITEARIDTKEPFASSFERLIILGSLSSTTYSWIPIANLTLDHASSSEVFDLRSSTWGEKEDRWARYVRFLFIPPQHSPEYTLCHITKLSLYGSSVVEHLDDLSVESISSEVAPEQVPSGDDLTDTRSEGFGDEDAAHDQTGKRDHECLAHDRSIESVEQHVEITLESEWVLQERQRNARNSGHVDPLRKQASSMQDHMVSDATIKHCDALLRPTSKFTCPFLVPSWKIMFCQFKGFSATGTTAVSPGSSSGVRSFKEGTGKKPALISLAEEVTLLRKKFDDLTANEEKNAVTAGKIRMCDQAHHDLIERINELENTLFQRSIVFNGLLQRPARRIFDAVTSLYQNYQNVNVLELFELPTNPYIWFDLRATKLPHEATIYEGLPPLASSDYSVLRNAVLSAHEFAGIRREFMIHRSMTVTMLESINYEPLFPGWGSTATSSLLPWLNSYALGRTPIGKQVMQGAAIISLSMNSTWIALLLLMTYQFLCRLYRPATYNRIGQHQRHHYSRTDTKQRSIPGADQRKVENITKDTEE